jgi:cell division transport system permease protein
MKAGAPLLPLQRQRPGSFALLIAATCLLMLLAAALALSLRTAADEVARSAREHILVQVIEPVTQRREAIVAEVLTRLDRANGVFSAQRVPEEAAEALVVPYIGEMNVRDLPVPAMIEVRARSREAVATALARLPRVQVTSAGAELRPLQRLIDALRAVAFGVALVAAGASGLIAILSARAALAREGATLDILHSLGATDRQMSRLVTAKVARDAAIGAAVGLAVAVAVIAAIGNRVAALGAGIDPSLGVRGWAVLASLAIALVGLSIIAAQSALLATWRRTP